MGALGRAPSPEVTRGVPVSVSLIRDLADQVLEVWQSERIQRRRRMWARYIRGEKVDKVPVVVFLIWGDRALWEEILPDDPVSTDPLEANIELQLKQKLWKWRTIPDDDLIRPWVGLPLPRPADAGPLWGVELPLERRAERGSSRPVPVFKTLDDVKRLRAPRFRWDESERREFLGRARALLGGKLPIFFHSNEMGESPFEHARRMCGMEALFLGVIDRPGFVHAVMEFVTDAMVRYHREREEAGFVSAEGSWRRCKVRWDEVPGDGLRLRLRDVWAYVSAQSAAPLSPAQYAEFLQPYHERVAEIFGQVYYHGCEDLTHKTDVITSLPNLRRFHVSPWTDLVAAARKLGRRFIIEKHVHSPNVLFAFTPEETRRELRRALDTAGDLLMEIHLSDISTIEGEPDRLRRWAIIAQEETARFSRAAAEKQARSE